MEREMQTLSPRFLCMAAIAMGGGACSTEPCGAPGEIGLVVEVREAGTGAPAATGATATVLADGFLEELTQHDDLQLIGLVDVYGTFLVRVSKPGYAIVEVDDVEVSDECGLDPTVIAVELDPL
jgi:hypothetical protein